MPIFIDNTGGVRPTFCQSAVKWMSSFRGGEITISRHACVNSKAKPRILMVCVGWRATQVGPHTANSDARMRNCLHLGNNAVKEADRHIEKSDLIVLAGGGKGPLVSLFRAKRGAAL